MTISFSTFFICLFTIRTVTTILNGKEAKLGEFTYQVALEYDGDVGCGGSLIGDEFILTAAHCVIDNDGDFINKQAIAIIGVTDLNDKFQPGVRIPIQMMYVNQEYRPEYENDMMETSLFAYRTHADIAVLRLQRKLEIDKYRNLVKLDLPQFGDNYFGKKAIVTGFGRNVLVKRRNPATNQIQEYLYSNGKMNYATVKIVPTQDCINEINVLIDETEMCGRIQTKLFNKKRTGICDADSGSPLVYKENIVIGIASTSPENCDESKHPSIYTRVTHFLDFIRDSMADKRTPNMRIGIWEENCASNEIFLYEISEENF